MENDLSHLHVFVLNRFSWNQNKNQNAGDDENIVKNFIINKNTAMTLVCRLTHQLI